MLCVLFSELKHISTSILGNKKEINNIEMNAESNHIRIFTDFNFVAV